eukprot:46078_1
MTQPLISGQQKQQYTPTLAYVNSQALSKQLYDRLCSNPQQAILLYDRHNNYANTSIYNGYDLNTFGITTMFNTNPSLSECETLWNKEFTILKKKSIKHSSIIIIESNPTITNPNEQLIKHALGRLLPINYRQTLQQKLDQFANELNELIIENETKNETKNENEITIQNPQAEIEEEVDHLTPDTDIDEENDTENIISNSNDSNDSGNDSNQSTDEIGDNSLLIFSGFDQYSIETMRQFIQIAQYIETQCLALVTTKYMFMSKVDQCVLILFENQSDAQLIINEMSGMTLPIDESELVIKYASKKLTNKIKVLFNEIDKKRVKFEHEMKLKRQLLRKQKYENEKQQKRNENQNENNKNKKKKNTN